MSTLEVGIDRLYKIQVELLELLEEAHDVFREVSKEDPLTAGVLFSAEVYWLRSARVALTRDPAQPYGLAMGMGEAIAALERYGRFGTERRK